MYVTRRPLALSLLLLLFGFGCRSAGFRPSTFTSNDALFQASHDKLNRHKWDEAITGFERLTDVLPARDPLLPLSLFYLAKAHAARGEYILAAQSYARVAEDFPDDTLADDAMFDAGESYSKMWRRPALDADYGETARSTFRTLLSVYPTTPLKPEAQREIERLNEWFATKSFQNGLLYYRRKAYDSALIYFKDVVKLYPQTAHARLAMLRMAMAYKAIRYKEEVAETCTTLHHNYPGDREVGQICGPMADTAAASDSAKAPRPPGVTP